MYTNGGINKILKSNYESKNQKKKSLNTSSGQRHNFSPNKSKIGIDQGLDKSIDGHDSFDAYN